jgi:hypothetical protein
MAKQEGKKTEKEFPSPELMSIKEEIARTPLNELTLNVQGLRGLGKLNQKQEIILSMLESRINDISSSKY